MDLNNPKTFTRLFTLPMSALLYFLGVFPLALEICVSFTNWYPVAGQQYFWDSQFIGPGNFVEFSGDPLFGGAILRTAIVVVAAICLEFLFGLGLALLFMDQFRGKTIFTSIILLPMMTVPAVTGYIFRMLFLYAGPVNDILSAIAGTQVRFGWLTSAWPALMSVILMDVWQWTSLMFLILLSGLLALPQDPINAAYVLGASKLQAFRHIMLPMMLPIILVAVVIRFMDAVKIFDGVFLMTHGGPGYSTQTLSLYLYEIGFKYMRLGYTAAMAITVLVCLALFTRFVAIKPLKPKV